LKAYRLLSGNITEIEVDVDVATGAPLLPPDTTVAARPDDIPGFLLTIVGNQWQQIEILPPTLEQLKNDKLADFDKHRTWYLNQPVIVNGAQFDGDKNARDSLTQALTVHSALGILPPAWFDYDNTPHALTNVEDLKAIAGPVAITYSTRYYEMVTMRETINAAQSKEELDAIEIPVHQD